MAGEGQGNYALGAKLRGHALKKERKKRRWQTSESNPRQKRKEGSREEVTVLIVFWAWLGMTGLFYSQ